MKIAIAGGTGLVGKALRDRLLSKGHEVIILTRKAGISSPGLKFVQWLNDGSQPEKELEGIDAFVNLAGASINSRWTDEYKRKILQSRLSAVSEVKRILHHLKKKPNVLINASAVGYYGTSLEKEFTESSKPGHDFLADTVTRWEAAAAEAGDSGIRVVMCRFGVVLDKNEGALPKMVLPYKFYAGGKVGSGRQWLSWIHIKDAVEGILFAIDSTQLQGPVNFSSPVPVTMDQFGKAVSEAFKKPHWIPVPEFMLKAILGEMSILILEGQRTLPKKLLDAGFKFRYVHVKDALKDIFG